MRRAVAVILAEPGSEELAARLEDALVRLMPATTRVELGILIEARPWPAGQDVVERFLWDAKLDVVPVDADLADRAMTHMSISEFTALGCCQASPVPCLAGELL